MHIVPPVQIPVSEFDNYVHKPLKECCCSELVLRAYY